MQQIRDNAVRYGRYFGCELLIAVARHQSKSSTALRVHGNQRQSRQVPTGTLTAALLQIALEIDRAGINTTLDYVPNETPTESQLPPNAMVTLTALSSSPPCRSPISPDPNPNERIRVSSMR
jgi:hypothetical protein